MTNEYAEIMLVVIVLLFAFGFTQCGHSMNNNIYWNTKANQACTSVKQEVLQHKDGYVVCSNGAVFKWREGYIDQIKGK